MGQELLKNFNEREIGVEGFLGQYASQIVNNYFQRRVWLANLHMHVTLCVCFYFYHVNVRSVKRALCLGGDPGLGCWSGRADFQSSWTGSSVF